MLNSRGPKPAYWNDPHYRQLVEINRAVLDAPAQRTAEILRNYPQVAFCGRIETGLRAAVKISSYAIYPAIILTFVWSSWPLLIVTSAFVGAWLLCLLVKGSQQSIRDNLLSGHKTELEGLEAKAKRAAEDIALSWDEYNICFTGYPPDWDERRKAVKQRDQYRCTQCGWPDGSKRRARNLHVHHAVPLLKGGDNSLENLATLCHVCHRKAEGPGHDQVRYTPRRSGYRRFGRRRRP